MARTYTMTAGSIIGNARRLLQDSNADVGLRSSDTDLLAALNEALNSMASVVPALFSLIEAFPCAASYLQNVEFSRAVGLLDVIGLPEADAGTLAQFDPGWTSTPAGTPENWMRIAGDPLRFMVYPPALEASPLIVRYVKAPAALTSLDDPIPISENYGPALTEYVVGRAELADDEHVNSSRASALLERFGNTVKALGA